MGKRRRVILPVLILGTIYMYYFILIALLEMYQEIHPTPSKRSFSKVTKQAFLSDEFLNKKSEQHNLTSTNPISTRQKVVDYRSLFPIAREKNMRIELQNDIITRKETSITIYVHGFTDISNGDSIFRNSQCTAKNCRVTTSVLDKKKADVLLYRQPSITNRKDVKPNQIMVMYALESPAWHRHKVHGKNVFNWTATYRSDSVINTPYGYYTRDDNAKVHRRNYSQGKTKLVAWMVSNCNTYSGRENYVKKLQKYVSVDIFGQCGNFTCAKENSKQCNEMLSKEYKFYLSFENSLCHNYITEKFIETGLGNDVVPIVMGARKEDYEQIAPPNSFIHVDDFDSPEELAKYIVRLDENPELYNEFFMWKGKWKLTNTYFWCRLCNMANIGERYPMWYTDIAKWWAGENECVKRKNGQKWASWKNHPKVNLRHNYIHYDFNIED